MASPDTDPISPAEFLRECAAVIRQPDDSDMTSEEIEVMAAIFDVAADLFDVGHPCPLAYRVLKLATHMTDSDETPTVDATPELLDAPPAVMEAIDQFITDPSNGVRRTRPNKTADHE